MRGLRDNARGARMTPASPVEKIVCMLTGV
jgi:hypothetical protein